MNINLKDCKNVNLHIENVDEENVDLQKTINKTETKETTQRGYCGKVVKIAIALFVLIILVFFAQKNPEITPTITKIVEYILSLLK